MAAYGLNNEQAGTQQATTTTYKTLAIISAATATLRRAFLYDLLLGLAGTPANNSYVMDVSRSTTVGTGTSGTPNPVDPADAASGTVGTLNCTAEPTVTAASSLFMLAMNQQSSYRWVAYGPQQELVVPGTNLNGLSVRAKSAAGTVIASAQLYFHE